MKKFTSLLFILTVILSASAQSDLFISEYVEGFGNNKAIEIYNPTSHDINLGDYVLKRYDNGNNSADDAHSYHFENRVIKPYTTVVCGPDKRTASSSDDVVMDAGLQSLVDIFILSDYSGSPASKCLLMNGDDAMVLEKEDGTKVDIFGKIGERPKKVNESDNAGMWTTVAPYNMGQGIGLSAEHTLVKKSGIKQGVSVNPTLFNCLALYDSLPRNHFECLGWHHMDGVPANDAPVITTTKFNYNVDGVMTANGNVIATIEATDKENDGITYHIIYGNYVYLDKNDGTSERHNDIFSLDKNTGRIIMNDADTYVQIPGDKYVYLNIEAKDPFGASEAIDVKIGPSVETGIENVNKDDIVVSANLKTINIKAGSSIKSVEIYNITGMKVYSCIPGSGFVSISSGLAPGSYFVKTILNGGNSIVRRINIR